MSLNQYKQIPTSITAVLQGLRLYPAAHPQILNQLDKSLEILTPIINEYKTLTLGMVDGTILLNDIPYLDQSPALQELGHMLERQQLHAVDFLPGLDSRQLLFFCQQLPQPLGSPFHERLKAANITAIQVRMQKEEAVGVEAVYKRALEAIEDVCKDVRLGRIPASRKIIKTVKGMVQTILEEPFALLAMAMLKDYDNYTFNHSVNVSVISMTVGMACGLSQQELYELGMGGLLHDLGKMTIDHEIVAKPGKLNAEETEVMKSHPVNGAKIVADMEQMPAEVVSIVNYHHLGYDRTGYPTDSHRHSETKLANMACIADTYDAMTTIRCYQRPRSPRQAIANMAELSGRQLHPEYLEKFLAYLGPYPVGTLVRLQAGSIGLVCDQNRRQQGSLTLKILFSATGLRHTEPELRELSDHHEIVAEVDPILKGVRLEDYLP